MRRRIVMLAVGCLSLGGMTAEVVTEKAPWGEVSVTVPTFPAREFSIADYAGDANKAMAACSAAGGGRVVVPKGVWLSKGPIHFKSNCLLSLEDGAELRFTDNPGDYLPAVHTTWEGSECMNYSPLIYAYGCTNVGIVGKGKIHPIKKGWNAWCKRPPAHMKMTANLYHWMSTNAPVAFRDVTKDGGDFRPHLIQFNRSQNILLRGYRVVDSPFWTEHLYLCKNVLMEGVDSFAHGLNNDGIDIEMTQDVIIRNCRFDQGDDGVVLKSGRNQDAWRLATPTKNVVVRDCELVDGHGLLVIGSEMAGGVENVYMHDCKATGKNVQRMFYLKTNERRGGALKHITMERCTAKNVRFGAFEIATDVLYQWAKLPTYEVRCTEIDDINMLDCEIESAERSYNIVGDRRKPIGTVRMQNVKIGKTAKSPVAKHVTSFIATNTATVKSLSVDEVFARAEAQATMLDRVMGERYAKGDTPLFPRSWTRGVYKVEPPIGWTTGFFPGTLWLIYAHNHDPKWKRLAERWTQRLRSAASYTGNHDLGFMFMCSYGLGIKYGGHGRDYADVIREAASSLAKRYDARLKLIRSWDDPRYMRFPVIIDSMMNLEMMWEYGYREIATNHADRVLANQYRPDGSAYHVTDYNPDTGKIWARYAWQGANTESAWARGQAWSIYGFTTLFRLTGRREYLERAVKSADWVLAAPTPEDAIPYWDYGERNYRDASAAAVIASGMLELASYVPDGAKYRAHAERILKSLSSDRYLSPPGGNGGFLLMHSVGHLPEKTEIDASINYADYYFLEALSRLSATTRKTKLSRAEIFADMGEDALASRLVMYWNQRPKDIFIRGERFDHVGPAESPVPTVVMSGNRSHPTEYRRPTLEKRLPYDDDPRGLRLDDGTFAPLEKTGTMVESLNREVLSLAADQARVWEKTGNESCARSAAMVLDTYLLGIYHRNVATDLGHGHIQTLVGYQSFEVIHENYVDALCKLYTTILPFVRQTRGEERIKLYTAAMRKIADNIIAHGVPHNNWDILQARFIAEIGFAIRDDSYIDAILNQSTIRQWSLKKLADYGYDPETGIWCESIGYSSVVLQEYAAIAKLLMERRNLDLLSEIPVLEKAALAYPQGLFPDGRELGFGDTHPNVPNRTAYLNFADCAEHFGRKALAEKFRKIAKGEVAEFQTPSFAAPKTSWLVMRTKGRHPIAAALNASDGNHMHANGISLELFGAGNRIAPDAGIGFKLYSGDDYKEYYSQFPAHNTVCVDGISTYEKMRSHHPFKICDLADNRATVEFHEPESDSVQRRTVMLVDRPEGGYFIDVFRSRRKNNADVFHDYFHHNLGTDLQVSALFNTRSASLDAQFSRDSEPAFAGAHLYAYSYLREPKSVKTNASIRACWSFGNVRTSLYLRGDENRKLFTVLAPPTEGLSRLRQQPYDLAHEPTRTLMARQYGEAWNHPFVAVIVPETTDNPSSISSVEFLPDEGDVVRVRVTYRDNTSEVHRL